MFDIFFLDTPYILLSLLLSNTHHATYLPPRLFQQMAELDAADEFVETMAWLSYLDEVDEQARLNFAGFGKRWAARRKDGLVGKPHPAKPETRTRSGTIGSDEGEVLLCKLFSKLVCLRSTRWNR